MRGNWDNLKESEQKPYSEIMDQEHTMLENDNQLEIQQQSPEEEQGASPQQEKKEEASTTPAWNGIIVKEEPSDEKNDDSGISPGHYISSSGSTPNRPSPPTTASGSLSPGSNSSTETASPSAFAYDSQPHSMMDYQAFDYAHNMTMASQINPKHPAVPSQSPTLPTPRVNKDVVKGEVTPLDLPQELENAPDALRCPVCTFITIKRMAFAEHVQSHCPVAVSMCLEANEFCRCVLKQLLSGSNNNSSNLDRASPIFDDCDLENTELGLRIPRINPQGKVKTFKCKQCAFVGLTKVDFWNHSREHIKLEKLLTCPRCPFVTEYKHHLEYHLRNHFGSKPFKCDQCNYSCVNKSMLNSHLKSHSSVYQFRCANCSYATKYCHSLKLHLRKYDHSPAMVLNSDGSPNPLPIIDVYGTRRGPKAKPVKKDDQASANNNNNSMPGIQQQQTSPLAATAPQFQFNGMNGFTGFNGQPLPATPQLLGFTYNQQVYTGFPMTTPNPFTADAAAAAAAVAVAEQESIAKMDRIKNFVDFTKQFAQGRQSPEELAAVAAAAAVAGQINSMNAQLAKEPVANYGFAQNQTMKQEQAESFNPLDLSKPEGASHDSSMQAISPNTAAVTPETRPVAAARGTSRRKGRAVRLDRRAIAQDSDEEMPEHAMGASPVGRPPSTESSASSTNQSKASSTSTTGLGSGNEFSCQFCEISFGNEVMHTVHMGYHGYQNPFTCNMCGAQCTDKVSFFLHIARVKH